MSWTYELMNQFNTDNLKVWKFSEESFEIIFHGINGGIWINNGLYYVGFHGLYGEYFHSETVEGVIESLDIDVMVNGALEKLAKEHKGNLIDNDERVCTGYLSDYLVQVAHLITLTQEDFGVNVIYKDNVFTFDSTSKEALESRIRIKKERIKKMFLKNDFHKIMIAPFIFVRNVDEEMVKAVKIEAKEHLEELISSIEDKGAIFSSNEVDDMKETLKSELDKYIERLDSEVVNRVWEYPYLSDSETGLDLYYSGRFGFEVYLKDIKDYEGYLQEIQDVSRVQFFTDNYCIMSLVSYSNPFYRNKTIKRIFNELNEEIIRRVE